MKNRDVININYISNWIPNELIEATSDEIEIVHFIIKQKQWTKESLHRYFKHVESILLENFRDAVNKSHIRKIIIPESWFDTMNEQWRLLALLRDFHDHACGRDVTHCVRTADCARFLSYALSGIKVNKFPKPVIRLLCGDNAPKGFIHPSFRQFN